MGKAKSPVDGDVDIEEIAEGLGEANELPPHDRARLQMAYVVISSAFLLMIAAGAAYLFIDDCRVQRAQVIFDFVKGFGPPLITLVLGFYFRDAFSDSK